MATKSMSYDHPAYTARHVTLLALPAVAASTPCGKFVALMNMRIKQIDCGVNIAGTNAASGYDIYNGTTSVGEITNGTVAAAGAVTGLTQDINLDVGAEGFLDVRTKANSATQNCTLSIEWEIDPGATVTA
jgi:hypothetical protein